MDTRIIKSQSAGADSKTRKGFAFASGLVDRLPAQGIAERNAEIRERYANGEEVGGISADYGLSKMRVYGICQGVGIKRMPKRRRGRKRGQKNGQGDLDTLARNAKIRERFANGEKRRVIAKEHKLTERTVSRICNGLENRIMPTAKRNAEIRERYANGETSNRLGVVYALSERRIKKICRGIDPRARRNAEIRERYANGETQKEIGPDYGLSPTGVGSICIGVERKVTPAARRNPEKLARNAEIRKEWFEGKRAVDLAKDYEVSVPTIYYICKGLGRDSGQ